MERGKNTSVLGMVFGVATIILCLYVGIAETPFSIFFSGQSISQSAIVESVVNVLCTSVNGQDQGGSGTVLTSDGVVITNSHVIPQSDDHLLTPTDGCMVILPNKSNGQPEDTYWARPIVYSGLSQKYDLAYLNIYSAYVDERGNKHGAFPRVFSSIFGDNEGYDKVCGVARSSRLGEPVRIFGYPQTSGGLDLTVTDGIISSIAPDGSLLTSAKVDAGNSGGLAVDKKGCMIGVPSAVREGEYQNLGVIIPIARVLEFSDAVSKLAK